MEGDPDGAGEVHLPVLREDHPATGAVPCHCPRPCRSEPTGDDPLCQIRPASAAQSAKRRLCSCSATLAPLVELIRRHVLAADRIHGDDTTVPVLAKNKTVTGRLWTYVRDDRPFGGSDPPAAMFFYSRDRGGEHPRRHLSGWVGTLQADAYAGFNDLYDAKRRPGRITEAACWAHGRRKFFVLADLRQVPLAIEAVRRIDEIFAVEREINGVGSEQRHAVRQERIKPLVAALEGWMRTERARLSRHADTAKAIDYMLKRWPAFTRFLDDGRICLTNNAAERALRGIAMRCSLCPSSS